MALVKYLPIIKYLVSYVGKVYLIVCMCKWEELKKGLSLETKISHLTFIKDMSWRQTGVNFIIYGLNITLIKKMS